MSGKPSAGLACPVHDVSTFFRAQIVRDGLV
jgi:hypothetical protein